MGRSDYHSDASPTRLTLHHDRAQIDDAQHRLADSLRQAGYGETACFAVRLAVEEALANAFNHGHADAPDEPVVFSFHVNADRVEIEVEDQGPGYCPDEVPDPTVDENLESLSGRGLVLMRAYMTQVDVIPPGNRVRMVYVAGG